MSDNDLMAALEQFDITEANLSKLERLWSEMEALLPTGPALGSSLEYDERRRAYDLVLRELPSASGFKPNDDPPTPDAVGQARLDYMELGEPGAEFAVDRWIEETSQSLSEYRFHLQSLRRALVRDAIVGLISDVDDELPRIRATIGEAASHVKIGDGLAPLKSLIEQIGVLIGSGSKPARWGMLHRHLHFGMVGDLTDIETSDWPEVRAGLQADLYGQNEPKPVAVKELGDLVAAKPTGVVTSKLAWKNIDDDGFERVLFELIAKTPGYENPQWLTATRAADRGRDLSVWRVTVDPLAGTIRQRVIIQCKHWLSRSLNIADIAATKEQMPLWGNPKVEVLVFATSGRFSTDAVTWIEQHNAENKSPRIEMWPDNHLEHLLSSRPGIVGAHGLR
ncbi:restriction endonuclease [Brevundimonas sp. FT23028]|uniref:restriction endonuclease n=1 Tax=Brevundimonas sp. FT23028 TaxID=3393748 RepID=UPI003B585E91